MKRRSARKASRSRLEPTFFTDRDLGKRFPERLRDAGLAVVAYHDPEAFPGDPEVSDEAWIRFACQRGYVGLTHDAAIRRDETLGEVFDPAHQPPGALFILRGGVSTDRLAEMFLAVHRKVATKVLRSRRRGEPFIAVIRRTMLRGGREEIEIRQWADRRAWEERQHRRQGRRR